MKSYQSDPACAGSALMEACHWLVALSRQVNGGTPVCPGEGRTAWDCKLWDEESCSCPILTLPSRPVGAPFFPLTIGLPGPKFRDIGVAWCWWRYFVGLYCPDADAREMERGIAQETRIVYPALEGNTAGRKVLSAPISYQAVASLSTDLR